MMPLLWGIGLAFAAAALARLSGFDRERGFYPVVLIVIASYYDLFAVMGRTSANLMAETAPFLMFASAAIIGFRTSLWIVVAALALHGGFDWLHLQLLGADGAPPWWPSFCASYDLSAAGCLAATLLFDDHFARRSQRDWGWVRSHSVMVPRGGIEPPTP